MTDWSACNDCGEILNRRDDEEHICSKINVATSTKQRLFGSVIRPDRLPDLELVGYLHRWYMSPKGSGDNQFLHHILAADEPIFHDHPWHFRSIILSGGYDERTTPDGNIRYSVGDVIFHSASTCHYITRVLPDTWTMVFTGPKIRDWGFMVNGEWVKAGSENVTRCEVIFRNGNT